MKDLGCEYDKETDQWYHSDPEKAQEAQRLVQEHEQRNRPEGIQKNKSIDF